MKAEHVRQRLSNIRQSYDGHMDLMLEELNELERLANIGKAIEWSLQKNKTLLLEYEGLENLLGDYRVENKKTNMHKESHVTADCKKSEFLLELGKATEKAFENGFSIMNGFHQSNYLYKRFVFVSELLEWAKKEKK